LLCVVSWPAQTQTPSVASLPAALPQTKSERGPVTCSTGRHVDSRQYTLADETFFSAQLMNVVVAAFLNFLAIFLICWDIRPFAFVIEPTSYVCIRNKIYFIFSNELLVRFFDLRMSSL
jgi:hypothetical protein